VRRFRLAMVVLLAVTVAAAGCSGGEEETPTQNAGPQAAAGDRLNLKGVCPDPIVLQTDWFPEAEEGVYYHLLGPGYKVDQAKKRVRGPLVAEGTDTGVQIEVRSGGPAIGFEPATAQLYTDDSITLALVNTDESVRFSAKQPTLAVVAHMEISPFAIMWDPATYPQFNIIADIGQTETKVFYFQGDTYMDYLIGSGILRRSQVDGSYEGDPATFVAQEGKVAQSAFATQEPYVYEHELPEWGKPVKYALIHDTGYQFYSQALSIRTADKQKLAPCLKKLVPIVQRSQVDFIKSPDKTNQLIVDVVKQFKSEWQFSPGLAKYSTDKMRQDFVNNGPDTTLGNFDTARVQRIIDIVTPIFTAQRQPPRANLKPEEIATNEFIDPSIGVT
jgi:hypothetical protein